MSVTSPDIPNEKEKKISIRKTNKPIMEKRRRARINSCLQQLKTLVLEAMRKDSSQYSKLEKADILEMTVKHLRSLQRQQMSSALASDPTVITKYRSGFNECTNEVMRYLGSVQNVNDDVRSRLVNHLSSCSQTVNATTQTAQTQPQPINIPQQQHVHLSQQQTTVRVNGLNSQSMNQSQVISQSINQSQTINQPQRFIQLSPTRDTKTQISGAFQIIPGNGLNGPVALYVGQLNDNECTTQTTVPVFSLQVPQETVKVVSSPTTLRNKENFSYQDSNKNSQYVHSSTPKALDFNHNHPIHCGNVNMNMYSEKLWRPW
ncbi:transcription factor HES-1-like [Mytilus californianus]|uniref:transcription factor HES-1-like n=1 Tax=Mytilus californianus TaxID=6549 RepID=UPI002245B718|nr:transcription factor HES-1-like [Mytilus californianus]